MTLGSERRVWPFGAIGFVAWLAVGIPFLIGVWIALHKAAALL